MAYTQIGDTAETADTAIIPDALEDPQSEDPESSNLLPLPLYDPYSWRETLFVINGRPFTSPNTREPLYAVWTFGTGLVVLSAFVAISLDENRTCRAWCSQFSLGPQPHAYVGVILFLLMAFRINQSYEVSLALLFASFFGAVLIPPFPPRRVTRKASQPGRTSASSS